MPTPRIPFKRITRIARPLALLIGLVVWAGPPRPAALAQQYCTTAYRVNLELTSPTTGLPAADTTMDMDGNAAERTVYLSPQMPPNPNGTSSGFDTLKIFFSLTDANTSITRLDLACLELLDFRYYPGTAAPLTATPKVCDDTSDGICTQTAAGNWQTASPGSAVVDYTLNSVGVGVFKCTWSVGTGSAGSSDDAEISLRWCTP